MFRPDITVRILTEMILNAQVNALRSKYNERDTNTETDRMKVKIIML